MSNKSFSLKFMISVFMAGFILCPSLLSAAPVEIPYVPLETSSFPAKLKTFCDYSGFTNDVCYNIKNHVLTNENFQKLEHFWGHEKELDTEINKLKQKSQKAKMKTEESPDSSTTGLTTQSTETLASIENKLVDGVADFIVTRAKAEAAYFFQSELKKELCGDKDEYKEYVPNLCVALDSLELSMSLNSMGLFLRSAVKKDLETLPDAFLKNASYKAVKDASPADVLLAARLIYPAYKANREGMSPLDILRGFSEIDLKCENTKGEVCKDIADQEYRSQLVSRIKIASILMRAFEQNAYTDLDFNNDINYIAVGFALSFNEMMKNKSNVSKFTHKNLNSLLNKSDQLKAMKKQMEVILHLVEESKKPVEQADATLNYDPKLRLQERLQSMDNMLALLDDLSVSSLSLFCKPGDGNCEQTIKGLRIQLYNLRQTSIIAKELLRGDEAAYMTAFLGFVSATKNDDLLPDQAKKIIPVMVEIANAKTSKDVANVLEAAAAPVGSYREKAKREMFSVTAFFGGSAGQESYTLNGEKQLHNTGLQAFAPIGFQYSWPTKVKKEAFRNWGVFFSLIDLGPIVSTETESGVESETNVGFKQLFAPGLYGTFNLYGPFNVGLGIAKTPDIMNSTDTGDTITDAWRYQGFIAMDLTLFPF